ncbi:MAG: N-6 DNA methylase [Verrucomicrobiales bacterium]|jgi:hypothetical protein|nr:N-6 DNA methylase [Verrucomicrobiales bacterium]
MLSRVTLTMNLPAHFRQAAHRFADALHKNFSASLPAQPEDQLKRPVLDLLEAAAANVSGKTEVPVPDVEGRPDIGVMISGALCGFAELKAPGHGARVRNFKGRDAAQWKKFAMLPNILYTDAVEWALYRSGQQTGQNNKPVLVRLDGIIEHGTAALDDDTLSALHTLLMDFLGWHPVPPRTPRQLAKTLAPLCRLLRADTLAAVRREDSALTLLSKEIRQYLFPHQSEEQFADIYAQTLTYALLLARISGETKLDSEHAAKKLDSGHGLLAQTLRILTQPAARAEIEIAVSLLERVIGSVEPDQLAKHDDLWLYFYEDFLGEYDEKLRKQHGVYYTPQEVIACQINLVSELLEKKFHKPLTFANDGVVFLDPAAGTGAYPFAAIVSALQKAKLRYGTGAVASHATTCAHNMNAFEILVGPYAVAHLRLGNLLAASGASLPADGLRVMLADTLESPFADPPRANLFGKKLTDEQARANSVKAEKPVFVCMGNPPYFREGAADGARSLGKWVRFGDLAKEKARAKYPDKIGDIKGDWARYADGSKADFLPPILGDFTAGVDGVHVKNLYNLYVYFWRWTLWKMFENGYAERRGIVSYITASSYLRGPGFAGMRQKMREAFDELWILDLEGDNKGANKTENVFAIQTPVCIAVGVRHAVKKKQSLAVTRYAKITGTCEEKLKKLASIKTFADVNWEECFADANAPLLPKQSGNYFSFPLLTDLFPWQCCGVKFERKWPIAEIKEVLEIRWKTLLSAPPDKKMELFHEDDDRKISKQYTSLFSPFKRLDTIASLSKDVPPLKIVPYGFRSFDRQYAIADNRIGGRMNPALWASHSDKQIYMASLLTKILGVGPSVTVSVHPPDMDYFCNRGGKDIIPLWRDTAATVPNITVSVLDKLSAALDITVSAEDFFAYAFAVMSAPAYTENFSEELSIPGPRLPITQNTKLFQRVVSAGRRLLFWQTYGERFAADGERLNGLARCIKAVPADCGYYPDDFSWKPGVTAADGVLRVGGELRVDGGEFTPISEAAWNFSVSGYDVVKNWLGFRMKNRRGKKSSPLDDIRPVAWTAALTTELLELLWIVEYTVSVQPELNALLTESLRGKLFQVGDFPKPIVSERQPPEKVSAGVTVTTEFNYE